MMRAVTRAMTECMGLAPSGLWASQCNSITNPGQPMPLQALPLPPAELGESPFWHPQEQCLYWCDIQGFKVHAWNPDDGHHRQWDMPSEPGCCAPAPGRRLVIGLRDGFYALDTGSGALA